MATSLSVRNAVIMTMHDNLQNHITYSKHKTIYAITNMQGIQLGKKGIVIVDINAPKYPIPQNHSGIVHP